MRCRRCTTRPPVRILAVAQDRGTAPSTGEPLRQRRGHVGRSGPRSSPSSSPPRRRTRRCRKLATPALSFSEREAARATAASTPSYPSGSTTTATLGWFLAAARHRRAADVDLLDALVLARTGFDGLGERVEVDHHQLERGDAELLQRECSGCGCRPAGRVHPRMQGLDAAVEHLGETGDIFHRRHRNTARRNGLRRRAGRHDGHAGVVQATRQVRETGLVVDADQRPPDGALPK